MGWRNSTHVIARRAYSSTIPNGAAVVVAQAAPQTAPLWSALPGAAAARHLMNLPLTAGARFPLLAIAVGAEASQETSVEGYRLWHQIALPDGARGWLQAAVPSMDETGSDGRPSSIRFTLLPVVAATVSAATTQRPTADKD
jgi:hypothetical protein